MTNLCLQIGTTTMKNNTGQVHLLTSWNDIVDDVAVVVGIPPLVVVEVNPLQLLFLQSLLSLKSYPYFLDYDAFAYHVIQLSKKRVGPSGQAVWSDGFGFLFLAGRRLGRFVGRCNNGLGKEFSEPWLIHARRLSNAIDTRDQNCPRAIIG